ncbi:hypothetical protein [Profundibacter sp.]
MTMPTALARLAYAMYCASMKRIFDVDDHSFLPWRFYGQGLTVAAGL